MLKKINKILTTGVSIFLLFLFVFPHLVSAQGGTSYPGSGTSNPGNSGVIVIPNPFKCPNNDCSIKGFIEAIINKILMPIGGMVAVLMIMYAGFMYVTAQGDTGKISKAHDALLYAVIGAAVLLGAFVISQAIGGTIDQLKR